MSAATADFSAAIAEAAGVLRNGGLVAFPTETVYGLGADATNEAAVRRVFQVKGRPPDNPVIVHVAAVEQFFAIGREIPPLATTLAKTFWPGPLTLVVRHGNQLPGIVTAGLPTVAVRMPDHPVALALIGALQRGIIGPSANISGRPSPTSAGHVFSDLQGKIELILDAGPSRIGVESTVLDLTTRPPTLLRLGGLPKEAIEKTIGTVTSTRDPLILRHSPGTRHRHYAPRARVILIPAGDADFFLKRITQLRQAGKRFGCLLHSIDAPTADTENYSLRAREEDYAAILFESMRGFDERGVDVILVECVQEIGLGEAVMDRLRRAAEGT